MVRYQFREQEIKQFILNPTVLKIDEMFYMQFK